MRAARLLRHGDIGGVEIVETPQPERRAGEVLVRLRRACLNHVDLYLCGGGAGITHALPQTLGVDGAGEVMECAAGETALKPGDKVVLYPALTCGRCEFCLRGDPILCTRIRILGEQRDGTMAEFISVPAANAVSVPQGWSLDEAAGLPTAYLTAWRMVVTRGEVAPSHTVLIHGIGGGVSLAALQIAKLHGATVIVTSSSDDKLAKAKQVGADHVINRAKEDMLARVMAITDKRGVDLVIENVGEATWGLSMRAVVRGGRIVVCGATSGGAPPSDLQRLFIRQIQVQGVTLANPGELRDMIRAFTANGVRPVIDSRYKLDAVPQALERLSRGEQFGKIVVEID
jgi:NADPH:quinone reductase-like Zn-dependent oxidoreductase